MVRAKNPSSICQWRSNRPDGGACTTRSGSPPWRSDADHSIGGGGGSVDDAKTKTLYQGTLRGQSSPASDNRRWRLDNRENNLPILIEYIFMQDKCRSKPCLGDNRASLMMTTRHQAIPHTAAATWKSLITPESHGGDSMSRWSSRLICCMCTEPARSRMVEDSISSDLGTRARHQNHHTRFCVERRGDRGEAGTWIGGSEASWLTRSWRRKPYAACLDKI